MIFDAAFGLGPVGALVSAYAFDSEASWFVFSCDFALSSKTDIIHLLDCFRLDPESDVICYKNSTGFLEPLFAIWKPAALAKLKNEFSYNSELSPHSFLRSSSVRHLSPLSKNALFNLNLPGDLEYLTNRLCQLVPLNVDAEIS